MLKENQNRFEYNFHETDVDCNNLLECQLAGKIFSFTASEHLPNQATNKNGCIAPWRPTADHIR